MSLTIDPWLLSPGQMSDPTTCADSCGAAYDPLDPNYASCITDCENANAGSTLVPPAQPDLGASIDPGFSQPTTCADQCSGAASDPNPYAYDLCIETCTQSSTGTPAPGLTPGPTIASQIPANIAAAAQAAGTVVASGVGAIKTPLLIVVGLVALFLVVAGMHEARGL
jgi:hypothetical protein